MPAHLVWATLRVARAQERQLASAPTCHSPRPEQQKAAVCGGLHSPHTYPQHLLLRCVSARTTRECESFCLRAGGPHSQGAAPHVSPQALSAGAVQSRPPRLAGHTGGRAGTRRGPSLPTATLPAVSSELPVPRVTAVFLTCRYQQCRREGKPQREQPGGPAPARQ